MANGALTLSTQTGDDQNSITITNSSEGGYDVIGR